MKKAAKPAAPKRGRPNVKGTTRRLSCRLSEQATAALEAVQQRYGLTPTAAVELALLHAQASGTSTASRTVSPE